MTGTRNRLLALGGALLAAGLTHAADLSLDRAIAFDRYPAWVKETYLQRLEAYLRGPAEGEVRGGLVRYSPLAEVRGAEDWQPLPQARVPRRGVDESVLHEARDYARGMNSSALMVWHAGALIEETYFEGRTREQPIISRSLAKPITVLAIGRALQEGLIDSLDQPVAAFIDEWVGSPHADILVRHLLDMRSGLLPQGFSDDPLSIFNLSYLHPHHEDLLVNHYPLVEVPGSRYEYSNATSELVAVLIERATGVPYHEWVSREVLAPLGAPGGQVWINREDGVAHAGCCILLPPEAWLRMGILLLQQGRWDGRQLLTPEFVAEMTSPTPQNAHAGMGVFLAGPYVERRGAFHPDIDRGRAWHSEPYLARDLFLFDGYANQVVYIVPSYGLVILRTGESPPREPLPWDNSFLPNLLMRAVDIEPRPPQQPR